ncbi:hypothetical protein [Streptomyces sp. SP17KL33]|uniref:hypothetical protein n=1 Tax=Streptomyces sp. SP17KL33 TaxID=3002534 RepID=UPI002E7A247C|nr:hypothetical protein [Streptomyces sp. SP17KL33]MEE1832180.1 hypothetical protein [Streptomyces sp. SP17KL33]
MGEPGVDVGLDMPARAAGEFVPDSFVALAGIGPLQLAQRLELIGARRSSAASSAWTMSSVSGS